MEVLYMMLNTKGRLRAVRGMSIALLCVLAQPSFAAEHAGDIEVAAVSDVLHVDPHGQAQVAADGSKIFEADFRDFGGGLYVTDDPGFVAGDGALAGGTQIWYQGLGTLQAWNGSSWVVASSAVAVNILDVLGTYTTFSSVGVTDPVGAIAQVSGAGDIHSHLDFSITGADRDVASAYLITLQLTSRGNGGSLPGPYAMSDAFHIAFNNGLGEPAFESAVGALMAPVPEPQAYALMLAGLSLLGAAMRRAKAG
jgi:hypothetical protein